MDAPLPLPPLVAAAHDVARHAGFPLTRDEAGPDRPSASIPEVGRLLAVLAAARPGGRIAELGTGCGVGAAWIASAMAPGTTLDTVELDPDLGAAAAEVLRDQPGVTVHVGRWEDVLPPLGPFDLVFGDAGGDRRRFPELVAVGGHLVLDDLTPEDVGRVDADVGKRALAFATPGLVATEVRTTATDAALLITRTA